MELPLTPSISRRFFGFTIPSDDMALCFFFIVFVFFFKTNVLCGKSCNNFLTAAIQFLKTNVLCEKDCVFYYCSHFPTGLVQRIF